MSRQIDDESGDKRRSLDHHRRLSPTVSLASADDAVAPPRTTTQKMREIRVGARQFLPDWRELLATIDQELSWLELARRQELTRTDPNLVNLPEARASRRSSCKTTR